MPKDLDFENCHTHAYVRGENPEQPLLWLQSCEITEMAAENQLSIDIKCLIVTKNLVLISTQVDSSDEQHIVS